MALRGVWDTPGGLGTAGESFVGRNPMADMIRCRFVFWPAAEIYADTRNLLAWRIFSNDVSAQLKRLVAARKRELDIAVQRFRQFVLGTDTAAITGKIQQNSMELGARFAAPGG